MPTYIHLNVMFVSGWQKRMKIYDNADLHKLNYRVQEIIHKKMYGDGYNLNGMNYELIHDDEILEDVYDISHTLFDMNIKDGDTINVIVIKALKREEVIK